MEIKSKVSEGTTAHSDIGNLTKGILWLAQKISSGIFIENSLLSRHAEKITVPVVNCPQDEIKKI